MQQAQDKSAGARILMVGSDSTLLETRCMVLERYGFQVFPASDLSEASKVIQTQQLDLLILCHSLASDLCDEVVEITHRHHPALKVLALTAGNSGCVHGIEQEVLNVFEGPPTLSKTIHRLTDDDPDHPASLKGCYP